MKLISVIVPVYNIEAYLPQCIRSVLQQTYQNWEMILVDDGSTDGSGEICDRAAQSEKRITVIHKENGGLSSARNAGIDAASGAYLTFLDGDDWIDFRYLEHLLQAKEKTGAQVAICGHRAVASLAEWEQARAAREKLGSVSVFGTEGLYDQALIGVPFFVSACTKLYDTGLFDGLRYPEGELYEDLCMAYPLYARIQRACFLDEPLYAYRFRKGSIIRSGFQRKKLSYLRFAEEGLAYIRKHFPQSAEAAEAKLLAAAVDTMLMIRNTGDADLRAVQEKCHRHLVDYRDGWMRDGRMRKIHRLVMALSRWNLDIWFARHNPIQF